MAELDEKNRNRQKLLQDLICFFREHQQILETFPEWEKRIAASFIAEESLLQRQHDTSNKQLRLSEDAPADLKTIEEVMQSLSSKNKVADLFDKSINEAKPHVSSGTSSQKIPKSSELSIEQRGEKLIDSLEDDSDEIETVSHVRSYLAASFNNHEAMQKVYERVNQNIPEYEEGFEKVREAKTIHYRIKRMAEYFKERGQLRRLIQISKTVLKENNYAAVGIEESSERSDLIHGDRIYTAFISYSWDPPNNKKRVLDLANKLRSEMRIIPELDQHFQAKDSQPPSEGWDLWMKKKIEECDFILLICTKSYKEAYDLDIRDPNRGRGVAWEAKIIRDQISKSKADMTRFVPIVFSREEKKYIPSELSSAATSYVFTEPEDLKQLYFRLNKKPSMTIPEISSHPFYPC